MTSGTCHLFWGRILNRNQILGQNWNKIQIFGVEFGVDPRFLMSLLRKMYILRSISGIFRKIPIFGTNFRISFQKLTKYTTKA